MVELLNPSNMSNLLLTLLVGVIIYGFFVEQFKLFRPQTVEETTSERVRQELGLEHSKRYTADDFLDTERRPVVVGEIP